MRSLRFNIHGLSNLASTNDVITGLSLFDFWPASFIFGICFRTDPCLAMLMTFNKSPNGLAQLVAKSRNWNHLLTFILENSVSKPNQIHYVRLAGLTLYTNKKKTTPRMHATSFGLCNSWFVNISTLMNSVTLTQFNAIDSKTLTTVIHLLFEMLETLTQEELDM